MASSTTLAVPTPAAPAPASSYCPAQLADDAPEASAKPFIDFLEENPTIFHSVDYFKDKLAKHGFTEVS